MAKIKNFVIILDDPKDTDNIEVGMRVIWVDRIEGAFGFEDYDPVTVKLQKWIWRCKRLLKGKK